jgi:tRNA (mo5U34)-methyltransferase
VTLQSSARGADPEIAALGPWFHNLHLPDGRQTAPDHPLGDFPAFKWRQIAGAIDEDLSGATALDIGCNAGFYSFQLAARGARVLAIDSDEHYLRQARWAARRLDPAGRVTFATMQVYDLAHTEERYDVVLFLGVLYHLRHPQLALDAVARLVAGRLVFQTLTMPGGEPVEPPDDLPLQERARLTEPGWPRLAFVERSLAGDPTNWWVADDACARAMLRSAGLRIAATPGEEIYVCEPAPDEDAARTAREAELSAAAGFSQRKYTPIAPVRLIPPECQRSGASSTASPGASSSATASSSSRTSSAPLSAHHCDSAMPTIRRYRRSPAHSGSRSRWKVTSGSGPV